VKEIRAEVEAWQEKLELMQHSIDELLKFQRLYFYLDNIFSADDIKKHMANESQIFFQCRKFWRDHLKRLRKYPHVLTNCTNSELLIRL
jgi:dynein heavy chain, axonemal